MENEKTYKDNNTDELIDFMLGFEHTLFQHSNSPNSRLKRNYSFVDMLQTEFILKDLNLLEIYKYAPNYISARPLLLTYLKNEYDFSFLQNLKSEKIILNNTLSSGSPADSLQNSIPITVPDLLNKSNSIIKHLKSFFIYLMNSNIYTLDLYKETSKDKRKVYYRLPFINIPVFLLLFTYFDGRNFRDKHRTKEPLNSYETKRLPYIKKEDQFSIFSYGLVLDHLNNLCNELFNSNLPVSKQLYLTNSLFYCDNIFFFHKLNKFLSYYELYLGDDIINNIWNSYRLGNLDVITLKETIQKEIFDDKDFIITGLTSDYSDFMLPFDIFFQTNILKKYLERTGPYGLKALIKDIADAKNKATKILKCNTYYVYPLASTFTQMNKSSICHRQDFSILQVEEELYNLLQETIFYKNYYLTENEFYKNASVAINNKKCFPNFQLIKSAIELVLQ